jgi:choline dehydrogenase-like flavoprotein
MIYIIGSGPSGIACAHALLKRGLSVTMLDAGLELEEKKQHLLQDPLYPDTLHPELRHQLNENNLIKLSYGSDYPYAAVANHIDIAMDQHIHCAPSFAKGGLSNVWGAFVEQYSNSDLSSWPITTDQLNFYYDKVREFMPWAMAEENSSNPKTRNYFHLSNQAKTIMEHFSLHKINLADQGFVFKPATLAVGFNLDTKLSCNYCGSCQHGCPRKLIYSSAHTLAELNKNPQFHYLQNIIVTHVAESAQAINLFAMHRLSKEKLTFSGSQLFCAAGPIISTQLILQATNQYKQKIRFADSTHFMLPCLMSKRVNNVVKEQLHTLCQLNLKLTNKKIASQAINLQIYTFMDHYVDKFKKIFGRHYQWIAPLLTPILDRLVVIQGHLASADSHQFDLELLADNKLQLTAAINNNVSISTKRLIKYLQKNKRYLGLTPISFMFKLSKICKSFHYGSSMPMSLQPGGFQTDIWGKPLGLQRLHVVDATIFPTIPAGSITPTIMANAYRIASECVIHEN